MSQAKATVTIIGAVGLYLATTAASFGAFRWLQTGPGEEFTSPLVTSEGGLAIDPGEPKDQECPINGAKFTKTERKAWEEKRPVVAMLENHTDARPQSGLSRADVVYEAVAEGGITRFMGVWYCGAQAEDGKIAPVRSARMYFVNLAQEYNTPIYVHVGGGNCSRDEGTGECTSHKKAWALEELAKIGWRRRGGNDFDTLGDIGAPVLMRDQNRLGPQRQLAVEHTMVGFLGNIWKEAAKRGFTNKNEQGSEWRDDFDQWSFTDDAKEGDRGGVAKISFEFWDDYSDFLVEWQYDTGSNSYKRVNGGEAEVDLETNQQLTAKNVIVQFVKEEGPLDGHKHMYYEVVGKGKMLVFNNGQITEGAWEKVSPESRTKFKDSKGKDIKLVGGQTWIELVPAGQQVSY